LHQSQKLERATGALHRLERMAKAVRRDIHKLHAFLRFREVESRSARISSPGSSPIIMSCAPPRPFSCADSPT
jgi:DNA polymerase